MIIRFLGFGLSPIKIPHVHSLGMGEKTVLIAGKTGSGKSSFCNAVFGSIACGTDAVAGCTRHFTRLRIGLGGGNAIDIIDAPGLGESSSYDEQYVAGYKEIAKKVDLIVWFIKADDRALTVDEKFFNEVIYEGGGELAQKVIFALSQSDKISPVRDWDIFRNKPGPKQMTSLYQKREVIFDRLSKHKNAPNWRQVDGTFISVDYNYNVDMLLSRIVEKLKR